MKTNRILLLIAGVFNVIIGGLGGVLGLSMLLLNKLIRQMFEASFEMVEQFIDTLIASDPSYEYLRDLDNAESLDFMMKSVKIIAVVFLLLGLLYVLFGIINLVVSKKFASGLGIAKGKKVTLTIFSWLLLWFNMANILTTIALFLKPKKQKAEYTLYSSKNT